MHKLTVKITRWIDDSQPGWVECVFRDVWGQEHVFHEKVPIVSAEDLDASSAYPQPGVIACEVIERFRDEKGRGLIKISTEKPWGCESISGEVCFDVLPEQLNSKPDGTANDNGKRKSV